MLRLQRRGRVIGRGAVAWRAGRQVVNLRVKRPLRAGNARLLVVNVANGRRTILFFGRVRMRGVRA